MNIGDLVEDEWGDLGIIIRQVGIIDRWVVKWLTGSETKYSNGIRAHWGQALHPFDSSETQKKVNKKT
tara:strand:- start:9 stop:212 length:204 start_codon:yes stop_codon:yes gene_type:complete